MLRTLFGNSLKSVFTQIWDKKFSLIHHMKNGMSLHTCSHMFCTSIFLIIYDCDESSSYIQVNTVISLMSINTSNNMSVISLHLHYVFTIKKCFLIKHALSCTIWWQLHNLYHQTKFPASLYASVTSSEQMIPKKLNSHNRPFMKTL